MRTAILENSSKSSDEAQVKNITNQIHANENFNSENLRVNAYDSLEDLPPEYDNFFQKVNAQSFFRSRSWFTLLTKTTVEKNTQLRLYAVEELSPQIKPKALLITTTPAAQNGARIRGWWVRASSMAGFTNHLSHTHSLMIPNSEDNAEQLITQLIDAIRQERPGCSLIDLNLFDPESELYPQVISAFQKSNMKVKSYFYAGNLYEDTSHLDFENYLNKRSSRVKKSLKQVNRIEKKHSFRFEMLTESKDTERAISILDSVSKKSWKEEDYFKKFFAELLHVSAAEGSMRVGVLYIDDKAVAADFAIITGNSAVGMKAVYDLDFSKYSLGSILHLYTIKYFIEKDFINNISFGLFDDDYKKHWCSQRRELWGIVAFNTNTLWGTCGYICYSLIQTKEKLKLPLKSAILKISANLPKNGKYIKLIKDKLKSSAK